MAEEILYEGDGAQVTTARAVIHGTTYPIANISSVRVQRVPRPILGVLFWLFITANAATTGMCLSGGDSEAMLGGAVCMGLLPALIAAGLFFGDGPKHTVILATAGGESKAYASRHREKALAVEAALNDAIIRRG